MARLIDADELAKTLDVGIADAPLYIQATVQQYIDCTPTLDPVHASGACYCQECKYWQEHYDYCKEFAEERNQGDFCSRGQRREGSQ